DRARQLTSPAFEGRSSRIRGLRIIRDLPAINWTADCSFSGTVRGSLRCICIMNGTLGWLKTVLIGRSRELSEDNLFHRISLIALFACVALCADGLPS